MTHRILPNVLILCRSLQQDRHDLFNGVLFISVAHSVHRNQCSSVHQQMNSGELSKWTSKYPPSTVNKSLLTYQVSTLLEWIYSFQTSKTLYGYIMDMDTQRLKWVSPMSMKYSHQYSCYQHLWDNMNIDIIHSYHMGSSCLLPLVWVTIHYFPGLLNQ